MRTCSSTPVRTYRCCRIADYCRRNRTVPRKSAPAQENIAVVLSATRAPKVRIQVLRPGQVLDLRTWLGIIRDVRTALKDNPLPLETLKELLGKAA